jgi:hypothetical protein
MLNALSGIFLWYNKERRDCEAMEPEDKLTEQDKKIKNLELELNDLRQGLTVVAEYYQELKRVSQRQDAAEAVNQALVRPLVDEDLEFESIWKFHEEVLVADPKSRVSRKAMYDAFVQYCTKSGRSEVDKDAFEFVFARIENPTPALNKRGQWIGYNLQKDRI